MQIRCLKLYSKDMGKLIEIKITSKLKATSLIGLLFR
jgi:hypothetical protein